MVITPPLSIHNLAWKPRGFAWGLLVEERHHTAMIYTTTEAATGRREGREASIHQVTWPSMIGTPPPSLWGLNRQYNIASCIILVQAKCSSRVWLIFFVGHITVWDDLPHNMNGVVTSSCVRTHFIRYYFFNHLSFPSGKMLIKGSWV